MLCAQLSAAFIQLNMCSHEFQYAIREKTHRVVASALPGTLCQIWRMRDLEASTVSQGSLLCIEPRCRSASTNSLLRRVADFVRVAAITVHICMVNRGCSQKRSVIGGHSSKLRIGSIGGLGHSLPPGAVVKAKTASQTHSLYRVYKYSYFILSVRITL